MNGNKGTKIALFLPTFRGGGVERVMVILANGFAELGFSVDLVLANAKGPFLQDVSANVRIVDFGVPRVLVSLRPLIGYLKREQPDAMLSAPKHANVLAILSKKLARSSTRLVVTEHIALSKSVKRGEKGLGKLLPMAIRFTYPHADAVVAVSKGAARALENIVGARIGRVNVIYNPVITPALLEQSAEPLNHPWFNAHQPPVILGVGRLSEQKDFATLIKAFAAVRAIRPARLMILGEGEKRRELEDLIAELDLTKDICLPGFVSNPYSYMRESSVFVLSSQWEGFGNVLIEALASGAQVISTDCPSGPAEILENGRWGRLVPVGNIDEIANNILEVLELKSDSEAFESKSIPSLEEILNSYVNLLLPPKVDLDNAD